MAIKKFIYLIFYMRNKKIIQLKNFIIFIIKLLYIIFIYLEN